MFGRSIDHLVVVCHQFINSSLLLFLHFYNLLPGAHRDSAVCLLIRECRGLDAVCLVPIGRVVCLLIREYHGLDAVCMVPIGIVLCLLIRECRGLDAVFVLEIKKAMFHGNVLSCALPIVNRTTTSEH